MNVVWFRSKVSEIFLCHVTFVIPSPTIKLSCIKNFQVISFTSPSKFKLNLHPTEDLQLPTTHNFMPWMILLILSTSGEYHLNIWWHCINCRIVSIPLLQWLKFKFNIFQSWFSRNEPCRVYFIYVIFQWVNVLNINGIWMCIVCKYSNEHCRNLFAVKIPSQIKPIMLIGRSYHSSKTVPVTSK